jgi:hypothetical protein
MTRALEPAFLFLHRAFSGKVGAGLPLENALLFFSSAYSDFSVAHIPIGVRANAFSDTAGYQYRVSRASVLHLWFFWFPIVFPELRGLAGAR